MTRRRLIYLIIACAGIGLADSLYLAHQAANAAPLFCDLGAGLDGCNQVAQSPYSRFFGIPLAYLGVLFYGLLGVAAFAALYKHHRYLHTALLVVAGVGALFSLVFLYIQFFLIQALCIYCIISAIVALASFGIAFYLDRTHRDLPAVITPTP